MKKLGAGSFQLEPDGFSIHTLEIVKKLSNKEYKRIRDSIYQKCPKGEMYSDRGWQGEGERYRCKWFWREGLRINLEKNVHKQVSTCYLRIAVNPRKLIDPSSSYLGILPPDEESIRTMSEKFTMLLKDSGLPCALNAYQLSRVDLCVNIRCDTSKLFKELLRVMRKLPTPPKYERYYYKGSDRKAANRYNKHHITFKHESRELVVYGDRVLHGFDEEQQSYLELGENYPVVFFNNPYEKMAHPYHYERYFRDKNVLTIYINYGFFSLKLGRNIVKMDIYSAIWKVCIDSPENYADLVKQQAIKGRNALITGYIKMDRLADFSTVPHERKMIIIAPHHTVMGWKELDISNFLMYSDFFAELPSHYPEIDFVFRPHPLLFTICWKNTYGHVSRLIHILYVLRKVQIADMMIVGIICNFLQIVML